ncbi:guided entry of tail-anchored proteins factor 1 [Selenihalanaerobacter shriftii]|uniref:Uncharacterized protein n=1 Tax=Selenihalanaerobacter shriftii TaxID=142842 RepID=A0A1T4NMI7_9FIRM|nr:hypothetical protein [Selenihalanaerobacter shriftii]SJZ80412.1 hypothetical protein SAMN02745118_01861 [Selenihalanaerobacter shriftii]
MVNSKKYLIVSLALLLILFCSQLTLYGADYSSLSKNKLLEKYKSLKAEFTDLKAKYTNLVDDYGKLKVKYDELKDRVKDGNLKEDKKEPSTKKAPTGC